MTTTALPARPPAAPVRKPGGSLLGLAMDGDRLEAVLLRRTNGSVEILQRRTFTLSLNPLTNEAALVGREIRKQLDEAGIRERQCAVCVPLAWVLTVHVPLPELSEEDLQGVLEIEAERGFPYAPDTLVMARSLCKAPDGTRYATLAAIPRDHILRLEAALVAAQLRPISFSLGISLLPIGSGSDALVLTTGATGIGLLASIGGGVAVLRSYEGAYELEGGVHELRPERVIRELRITLGQLPAQAAGGSLRLRVVGHGDEADELAEALQARAGALDLKVEQVRELRTGDLPVGVPAGTKISPALCLAARLLAGQGAELEFLPPKISAWRQFSDRYSSRKLLAVGSAAGAVALLVLLAFLVQQAQLWYWESKWRAMQKPVGEIEGMRAQLRRFRPWCNKTSFPTLSVLRRLTEAFPEESSVTARSVEIREPSTVTCTGTARDRQALLKALEKLGAAREVSNVKLEVVRGRSPMEFSFNFQWNGPGGGS